MDASFDNRRFRLHVAGLAASVTAPDIVKRFSAFGTVIEVDGIGKLDANGQPFKYAFLELETSQLKLNRCMNMLSGTIYKGETIRIALAKPNYIQRAALEREVEAIQDLREPPDLEFGAEIKQQNTMRKFYSKSRKGVDGYQSDKWQLMTVKRFKQQDGISGWKKDPSTSLPIFPLIARPIRPLPRLPDETTNPDAAPLTSKPLIRARRVRIDPASYRLALNGRNTHLLGPRAISIELYRLGHQTGSKETRVKDMHRKIWECEDHQNGKVVWRLKNGNAVEVEEQVELRAHHTTSPFVDRPARAGKVEEARFTEPPTDSLPPRVASSTKTHRATEQYRRCSAPTTERQAYLNILRDFEPNSAPQDPRVYLSKHQHFDPSSNDTSASGSGGEQISDVTRPQANSSFDMIPQRAHPTPGPDGLSDTETPTSESLAGRTVALKTHPGGTIYPPNRVLRLKGGAAPSLKRKRKSRLSSQSLSEDIVSSKPPSKMSSIQSVVTEPIHEVRLAYDACDPTNPELEAERKAYLHTAQQIVSTPQDSSQLLQEVGQGSKDVVERQKLKEAKREAILATDLDNESPIEYVPQIDVSSLDLRCASREDIYQQPTLQSEVKLSSLSEMFKAKETEQIGFSLQGALAGLELETEDPSVFLNATKPEAPPSSSRIESTARRPNRMDSLIHPSRLALAQTASSSLQVPEGAQIRKHLFFPAPIAEKNDLGIPASVLDTIRKQTSLGCKFSMRPQGVSHEWRTFVRTETISEIEEQHNAQKADLTEQMRRKHKDAVKWAKKWGKK